MRRRRRDKRDRWSAVIGGADEALSLSAKPCRSGALAAAGRARALVRIGDTASARDAVRQTRAPFDQVGGDDSDAAFRFPVKRFPFYLAGVATWMGDTQAACRLQDEALTLYRASNTVSIDSTLILLDRDRCLVDDSRADEAATVALDAVACCRTSNTRRSCWPAPTR